MGQRMEGRANAATRGTVVASISIVALCVAVAVILLNVLRADNECGDNSGCAVGGTTELWQGRVFTQSGAPAAHASVHIGFLSIAPDSVALVTDRLGRYCLRWPRESQVAAISAVTRGTGGAPVPAAARLARQAHGPVVVTPDINYLEWYRGPGHGAVTNSTWNANMDATSQCVSDSPPWYRMSDLSSNWRSVLITVTAILAVVLTLIAGVAWIGNRPWWPRIAASAGGSMIVSIVALILVWFPLPRSR